MRYQTAAAGETWAVHGRFISGRTVTAALFNGESGASIALDSSACAEIGSTGIYRFNSTDITTDPTALTSIVWQMTDSTSGLTDEGIVVVGGALDTLDADVSSRSAPGDAMDLVADAVDSTSVASGAITSSKFAAGAITSTVLADSAITAAKIASAAITSAKFGASAITATVLANDAITAAKIAANAIGASELATDAVTEISTGILAALLTSGESVNTALSRLDNIDTDVQALNDLSIADVQTALTSQGYTSARATLLDNLDVAVSVVAALIAALNDLSSADVQSAMTAQGYTTVRAALLDNLDATISSRASQSSLDALNDLSSADIQSALTAQGYTSARATNLDNLDAAITAVQTSLSSLSEYVQGGREIDFTGNDALGWQRIERNTAGTEVRRYNLFDESDARITGTVSAFLAGGKMIAKEVLV